MNSAIVFKFVEYINYDDVNSNVISINRCIVRFLICELHIYLPTIGEARRSVIPEVLPKNDDEPNYKVSIN